MPTDHDETSNSDAHSTPQKGGAEELRFDTPKDEVADTPLHENGNGSEQSATSSNSRMVPIAPEDYVRYGFFRAIEASPPAPATLQAVLTKVSTHFDDRERQLVEQKKQREADTDKALAGAEADVKKSEDRLAGLKREDEALQQEKKDLEEKLGKIRSQLHAAYKSLATKRERIVDNAFDKRLSDHEREIDKILDSQLVHSKKKHQLSKENFEEGRASFEAKVSRFEAARTRAEEAFCRLDRRVQNLAAAGMTGVGLVVLTVAGYLGVIASGWLFSILLLQNTALTNTDYISFLLRRIYDFAERIGADSSDAPWIALLSFLGVWLALLALTGGVAWVCHWLADRRYQKPWENAGFVVDTEEERIVGLYERPNADSGIRAWLRAIPYVMVVGVVFALISFAGADVRDSDDLNSFLITLSGEFIGALLTMVVTGLLVLYVSFIIEPRMSDDNPETGFHFRQHWEVGSLFILLGLLLTGSAVYVGITDSLPPPSLFSLTAFGLVLFCSAFSLAYGYKFRGLLAESHRTERYIRNLSYAIEDNSRPRLLDLRVIDGPGMRQELESARQDLFAISRLKTEAVKQLHRDVVNGGVTVRTEESPVIAIRRVTPWLKRILLLKEKPPEEHADMTVPDPSLSDSVLFPEDSRVVAELKDEWQAVHRRLMELDKLLSELRRGNNGDARELQRSLDNARDHINRLRQSSRDTSSHFDHLLHQNRLAATRAETDARDGFDLGVWYFKLNPAESGIGTGDETAGGIHA